jgi:hypothetical protein
MKYLNNGFLILLIFYFVSCDSNQPGETESQNSSEISQSNPEEYVPRGSIDHIEELVFVYISAEWCGFCSEPESVESVKSLKTMVKSKADSLGIGFLAIGISLDWEVDTGYQHLKKFGAFDEISVGSNWFGIGGLKYLFDDIPGRQGIPQILITKRIYDADVMEDGRIRNKKGVKEEVELIREIGPYNLVELRKNGVKLPEDI